MLRNILVALVLIAGFSGVVSAAPTLQYRQEATLLPISDDAYDLGTTTKRWRNLYVNTITTSGGTAVSGSGVSGRVPFWNGTNSLSSDSTFLFDSTLDKLTTTNASTTNLSVTGTGTTTFAGGIDLTSGSSHITAHGIRSDGSDGLHVHANNWTDVALFGAGNTANSLFYGGVNIDGATRLATSLTGLIKATSGALTAATADIDYQVPLTFGDGLTRTVNDVDCDTASGSVFGCLSAADWTTFNNKQAAGNYITALTGDVTASGPGSVAATLATVNGNVGSFGSATQTGTFTVNGKGLITAASNTTITPAIGSITGLGTGVGTALAVNVGTAGAFVVNGGALGTPSSGTLTNATGLLPAGMNLTKGNFLVGNDAGVAQATSTIFISSTGNVGIGTTSPTQFLDLYKAGDFSISMTNAAANGNRWAISNVAGTGNAGGLQVYDANAGAYRMAITNSGNVGIGTTTPSAKLGIGGTGTLFELLDTAGSMVMRVVSSTVTLLGTWDFSGATVKTHEYSSFTYATSTAWTATTTIPLGPAATAESWDDVMCFTDTGTLNVSIYDGTNRMNMFNASTTVGTVDLSTNNTFTASEKRYVDVGTPASTPTKISCTVDRIVNF